MGLDIGFTLYEKKPFDEEGKFIAVDVDDNWRCGWGRANEAFGEGYFEFGDECVVPVFQKGLADKKFTLEEFSEKYRYVPFEDFRRGIEAVLDEIDEEAANTVREYIRRIHENERRIEELRNEQRKCTEEQSYAFERWGFEIDDLRDSNESMQDYVDRPHEDDEVRQAKGVRELLDMMEEYLKEDRYYVVPYFSC